MKNGRENFDVGWSIGNLTVMVVLLFLIGREPIKVAAKLSIHPSRRAMRWSVLTRASTVSSCETNSVLKAMSIYVHLLS